MIDAGGGVHVGVGLLDEGLLDDGLLDEGLKAIGEVPDVPDAAVVDELQASEMIEISTISPAERLRTPTSAGREMKTLASL